MFFPEFLGGHIVLLLEGFGKMALIIEHDLEDNEAQRHISRDRHIYSDHIYNVQYPVASNTLINLLSDYGYENIELYDNVLPESNIWNGKNVSFCLAYKF